MGGLGPESFLEVGQACEHPRQLVGRGILLPAERGAAIEPGEVHLRPGLDLQERPESGPVRLLRRHGFLPRVGRRARRPTLGRGCVDAILGAAGRPG